MTLSPHWMNFEWSGILFGRNSTLSPNTTSPVTKSCDKRYQPGHHQLESSVFRRPTGVWPKSNNNSSLTIGRLHLTNSMRPCRFAPDTISDSSSLPVCTEWNIICLLTITVRHVDRPAGLPMAVVGKTGYLFDGCGDVNRVVLTPPLAYDHLFASRHGGRT